MVYSAFIAGDLKASKPENIAEPAISFKPVVSIKPENSAFSHLDTMETKLKHRLLKCDRMRQEVICTGVIFKKLSQEKLKCV